MGADLDLLLVRHGLTDSNETGRLMGRSEIPLNSRGRAQATAVGEALRDLQVWRVLSSPQRRTLQTAELIAQACDVVVESEPALAEVWLDRWQGKTCAELRDDPDLRRYLADPAYRCDAIEPGADIAQRVVDLVERLRTEAGGRTVVLVSHGDPLRILLAHYLTVGLAGYRHLELAPGSVSVLRFTARARGQLCLLNWRPQQQQDQLRW